MTFNEVNSWGVSIPKAQELQHETAINCNCVRLAVAYDTKKVGIKTLTKQPMFLEEKINNHSMTEAA